MKLSVHERTKITLLCYITTFSFFSFLRWSGANKNLELTMSACVLSPLLLRTFSQLPCPAQMWERGDLLSRFFFFLAVRNTFPVRNRMKQYTCFWRYRHPAFLTCPSVLSLSFLKPALHSDGNRGWQCTTLNCLLHNSPFLSLLFFFLCVCVCCKWGKAHGISHVKDGTWKEKGGKKRRLTQCHVARSCMPNVRCFPFYSLL